MWYCEVINSICLEFGMQLLKNDTVKQHENHLSVTWGDAEQESGGVCRKQFDFDFQFDFCHKDVVTSHAFLSGYTEIFDHC